MNIEVVTPDADGDRGGFGARVHMLLSMLARFATVRCLLTSWPRHPTIDGVTFAFAPIPETRLARVQLLRTFYSTKAPRRPPWPRPDLLLVENLDLLAARRSLPSVPVVLDEHNVYWNLLRYDLLNRPFFESGLGRNPAIRRFLVPRLLARATRFEVEALRRVEGVLVTSSEDRDALLAKVPAAASRIHVVPNCVDAERYPVAAPEAETGSVLFAGNFNYVPNREAARVIAETLAPNLPTIPFVLAGKDPPADLPRPTNVRVLGHVADLGPILAEAAVCIAPLVHGSGTRIKILTYLAAGKAVVATTKACEGLDVVNEKHLLIRDDWTAFLAGIHRLLVDPAWRLDLGREGRALVLEKYDWRRQVPALREALERTARAG